MSVANLAILHGTVGCALALVEDREVEGVEAPAPLDIAGVQAMGAGKPLCQCCVM